MPTLIVEVHVPLTASPDVPDNEYQFPWILDIDDFIEGLDPEEGAHGYDEGEEYGDVYVFFLTGVDEGRLLSVASEIASRPGVPAGVFAMVTDDEAEEWGLGRRVDLPLAS